ncbi:hypothetical protein OGAPHI_003162 [Ogataea philodendri]|uniref:Uncharacterized protein n=1 Tax=Ogataea philodendri TaxID=1378263 RepID=A0A9P8P8H4_9ASCO|nr:uncharacterized protein OGAPHI_003162 [Ogataea philodendri]KAH3667513.1 hypothetical protein OGAPHI_003162 [Ogataea philodendri]
MFAPLIYPFMSPPMMKNEMIIPINDPIAIGLRPRRSNERDPRMDQTKHQTVDTIPTSSKLNNCRLNEQRQHSSLTHSGCENILPDEEMRSVDSSFLSTAAHNIFNNIACRKRVFDNRQDFPRFVLSSLENQEPRRFGREPDENERTHQWSGLHDRRKSPTPG